jgi:superoxide dismutase, Fe-Mn family
MPYEMKPLACDPARIKGMSERLIVSHYENSYGGAVKRLNLIEEQLAGLDFATAPGFVVNGLKREQLVAMNSMILHEVFFDSLGEESEPGSELVDALARDFGSFERWRAEFTAMGKALGGGSGWVLLTWSPRDGRLVNQWAADHTTTLAGGRPILALDMYEHSYHIDFGAKAATYVDTFMQAIRWATADRLYAWLKQAPGPDPRLAAACRASIPPGCGSQRGLGGELPGERSAFVHAGVGRRPAGARLRPSRSWRGPFTWQ